MTADRYWDSDLQEWRWSDSFNAFLDQWIERERYAVHHIDGNPRNNDLANLRLVKLADHRGRP